MGLSERLSKARDAREKAARGEGELEAYFEALDEGVDDYLECNEICL